MNHGSVDPSTARSLDSLHGERVIPEYDASLWAWHSERYRFATAHCGVAIERAIDVGCGEGYGASMLAEHATEVIGVDLSAEAVALARSRYRAPNLHFLQTDATTLSPDRFGKFDVITAFEVIEHVPDPGALLVRLGRMLTPEGTLFVSTPNAPVEQLHQRLSGRGVNPYHISPLTPLQFGTLCRGRFAKVELFGQTQAGNAAYMLLKSIDIWHLRHRLRPWIPLGRASKAVRDAAPPRGDHFTFERSMWRTAAIIVAVVSCPLMQ